jgi:polysaccharide export outer membrane protein
MIRLESLAAAAVLLAASAVNARSAPADQPPPKELLQYVQQAKRLGLAEARIKTEAVSVGWASALVDEAMAFDKTGKPPADGPASEQPAPAPQIVPVAASAPVAVNAAPPAEVPAPSVPPREKSAAAPVVRSLNRTSSDDYLIGSGDTLQISVWNQPEASVPSVVVRPDGKVTMPLIKDVAVAGLTPREAEKVITTSIGEFFSDPNVTVIVAAINSKKIYLIGAVKKEGPLPYSYGMTIMQALSEAGGLTDYAKRRKIYILRSEAGREYRLDFNYDEVIRGERMEQNAVLLAGDTLIIPQ